MAPSPAGGATTTRRSRSSRARCTAKAIRISCRATPPIPSGRGVSPAAWCSDKNKRGLTPLAFRSANQHVGKPGAKARKHGDQHHAEHHHEEEGQRGVRHVV